MPCVHVFRSANHQLGLYLRRMFVPRSKNVVSNAEIHDVGGLKSTAKVSLYDHDYGPSYYARCHKVVAQCTVLLYVRHGLELGCSSWSVFSTDGDRREHRFFVLEASSHRRKTTSTDAGGGAAVIPPRCSADSEPAFDASGSEWKAR